MDQEYLKRPLIQNVIYFIDNDRIKIQCNHTSWINNSRNKKINKVDLLDLYSKVYQLAKEKKVIISMKNGYKKYINNNWGKYKKEFEYYDDIFDQLIIVSKKIKERGLHDSTRDDKILNEALKLKNKYITSYYRDSINCEINDIYNSLREIHEGFFNYNYTKIVL